MESDKNTMDQQKDAGLTMLDILKEEQDLEDDANAVLGGSDDKFCTYSKGYIKRQALYACTTCTPEAVSNPEKRAGICLACSYHCHESHELVELYTKRNFRCDCGGPKIKNNKCNLDPFKNEISEDNLYNQNFSGLYCKCSRPYPDPEDTVEDEMIQCIICEDWYHCRHLGSSIPSMHNYSEMICSDCMTQYEFLQHYLGHAVTKVSRTMGSKKKETKDIKTEAVQALITNEEGKSKIISNNISSDVQKEDADSSSNKNETKTNLDASASSNMLNSNDSEEVNVEMETEDDLIKTGLDDTKEANVICALSDMSNHVSADNSVQSTENGDAVKEHESEGATIGDNKSNIVSPKKAKVNINLEESQDSQDSIVKETANLLEEIANMNKEFNKNKFENSNKTVEDIAYLEKSVTSEATEGKAADKKDMQYICENAGDLIENTKEDVALKDKYLENSESHADEPVKNEVEHNRPAESIMKDNNNEKQDDVILKELEQSEPQNSLEVETIIDRSLVSCESEGLQNIESEVNLLNNSNIESDANTKLSETKNDVPQNRSESDMEIDEENIEFPANVVLDKNQEQTEAIHKEKSSEISKDETLETVVSSKRRLSEENSLDNLPAKRQKVNVTTLTENECKLENKNTDIQSDVKGANKSEVKPDIKTEVCTKPLHKLPFKGAVFWSDKWRKFLCSCSNCLETYKGLKVSFLLDMEDTVQCYEEQGKTLTTSQYEIGMRALSSLDHVKQVNAITEYNKMKDKLKIFLQTFADNQQIVTEDDIKQFFESIKGTKRSRSENPYFCR